MSRATCRLALALAVTTSVTAVPLASANQRGRGAVTRFSPRAPRTPHDSYRMNGARRAWARARGQLTDVKAAALVADGKLSHREAFLLVRSGVEARRVARAIAQEPEEVGIAFGARTDKLQRLGLSRREARILARCGARPVRVRELLESLVYRFLAGTDPAWAVPPDSDDDSDEPDGPASEAMQAARLQKALRYLRVDPDQSKAELVDAARRAYRKVARSNHPDVIGARTDLEPAEKAAAVARFRTAAEHYEAVVDILQPPAR
jgi:hypothetical protein